MNLEVIDDEAMNTLLFFKNNSMEEGTDQSSGMEKEKMGHNIGGGKL